MRLTYPILMLSLLKLTSAASIDGCTKDRLDLIEEANATVRCSGINGGNTMKWYVNTTYIGTCYAQNNCSTSEHGDFAVTRPENRKSDLVFLRNPRTYAGNEVNCQIVETPSNSATCRLRIIHPANLESCKIERDTKRWTVFGSCHVGRIFASDGVYSCTWKLGQNKHGAFESDFTDYIDNMTGRLYKRGTCSFTAALPAATGNYQCSVNVAPGPQEQQRENIAILRPSQPVVLGFPEFVPEGGTLNSTCWIGTDPGSPPANEAYWLETNTSQLILRNVTRRHNDVICTCRLIWGPSPGVDESVTLRVAYGPTRVTVSGPSKVMTSTTVTLECKTDDVNPTPQYEWTGITCDDSHRKQFCSFTATLTDNGRNIFCTAKNPWQLRLTATGSIMLVAQENGGRPDAEQGSSTGSSIAGIVGGVSGVVVVAVGVVVFFTLRKYRQNGDRDNTNYQRHIQPTDHDSEAHVNPVYTTSDGKQFPNSHAEVSCPYINTAAMQQYPGRSPVTYQLSSGKRDSEYSVPLDNVQDLVDGDVEYFQPVNAVCTMANSETKQAPSPSEPPESEATAKVSSIQQKAVYTQVVMPPHGGQIKEQRGGGNKMSQGENGREMQILYAVPQSSGYPHNVTVFGSPSPCSYENMQPASALKQDSLSAREAASEEFASAAPDGEYNTLLQTFNHRSAPPDNYNRLQLDKTHNSALDGEYNSLHQTFNHRYVPGDDYNRLQLDEAHNTALDGEYNRLCLKETFHPPPNTCSEYSHIKPS